jgi:hypothetical protein
LREPTGPPVYNGEDTLIPKTKKNKNTVEGIDHLCIDWGDVLQYLKPPSCNVCVSAEAKGKDENKDKVKTRPRPRQLG